MLEKYLFGELVGSEEKQIEGLLASNTKVRDAYQKLEADLEQMAQENAIVPPIAVKERVFAAIKQTPGTVIPLERPRSRNQYFAIAAALALLFGITSVWLFTRVNSMEENLRLVEEQNSVLKTDLEDLVATMDETMKWYDAINDPNAIKLVLEGNDKLPDAKAISYVNHVEKTVVLNAQELPELASDKDYQLWADVEGEMIDMGVITKDRDMIAMNYIDNAASLNITIEPAGGNDHPTVSQLISNVYLE